LTVCRRVSDREELEAFFEQSVAAGCEGLVCKSLAADAVYQAGARGWLWIKLKREYRTELRDTFDLVVVGAFYGRGKRAGAYGALLLAAYDEAEDRNSAVSLIVASSRFHPASRSVPPLAPGVVSSGLTGRAETTARPDACLDAALVPARQARADRSRYGRVPMTGPDAFAVRWP
jgi:ATP dependent DNA ligase domain